jgi:hypothetical protein
MGDYDFSSAYRVTKLFYFAAGAGTVIAVWLLWHFVIAHLRWQ